jgi:3D (Asp-Asp-Asp) domain-containing protein
MYIARWGRSARAIAFCVAGALAGCEGTTPLPVTAGGAAVVSVERVEREPIPPPAPAYGRPLGVFQFTMYYVAAEADHPEPARPGADASGAIHATVAANDNALSGHPDELSGGPDGGPREVESSDNRTNVTLYHRKGCAPIAQVGAEFAAQLDIQGTGKLRDGRVVNTSGSCRCPNSPCYFEIDNAWAMGPKGRLSPFRSVAVDTRVIPLGTVLYLPELDGVRMPGRAPWGGFVHDGCVVAEDRGGGIRGHDIDFFVARKTFSNILDARHRLKKVGVFEGTGWCEKRNGKVARARARAAL